MCGFFAVDHDKADRPLAQMVGFAGLYNETLRLQGTVASLASADSPYLIEIGHEDLAVADLSGFCAFDDRLDRAFNEFIAHSDFNLRFWQKIDDVFGAAIQFSMPALPAETFDLADRHTLNSYLAQSVTDIIEAKRFNYGGDKLHSYTLCGWLVESSCLC